MDLFAPTHLLILLAIILVLFGPSKLGDIGGTLAGCGKTSIPHGESIYR